MAHVIPNYETGSCSSDKYDKINCEFAEVIYQEIASIRYGIEFCCKTEKPKWEIKKYLVDLDLLHNPDACPSICE